MKPVKDMIREVREEVADLARIAWSLRAPSTIMDRMKKARAARKDAAIRMRLNRQARQQFIRAFNMSATRKMSVEVNEGMKRYKFRNGVMSAALRPYESFSLWNLPGRIATAAALCKAARMALYPLMGLWSVAVPLVAFGAARMALIHRNAENERQEKEFGRQGLVPPCTFEATGGNARFMGRDIPDGHALAFPILHRETPEWLVSKFDTLEQSFSQPRRFHAAMLEALRARRLSWQSLERIDSAFPKQKPLQNCAAALAIIFPGQTLDALVADVRELAAQRVTATARDEKGEGLSAVFRKAAAPSALEICGAEAALRALEPFCMSPNAGEGLSALAGRASMDDIRYLVHLQSVGIVFTAGQAKDAVKMIGDPRFSGSLCFRQIAETALLPKDQSEALQDLLKDREYRARFGYDLLRDIVQNMEGWGGTALKLSQHGYAKSLSGAEIAELAQPENQHWAKVYHDLRVARQDAVVPHAAMKAAVQARGYLAFGGLRCAT